MERCTTWEKVRGTVTCTNLPTRLLIVTCRKSPNFPGATTGIANSRRQRLRCGYWLTMLATGRKCGSKSWLQIVECWLTTMQEQCACQSGGHGCLPQWRSQCRGKPEVDNWVCQNEYTPLVHHWALELGQELQHVCGLAGVEKHQRDDGEAHNQILHHGETVHEHGGQCQEYAGQPKCWSLF